MEIRFYNRDMTFLGVMENHRSMIWTRKYYEPGKVMLVCPFTEENLRLTQRKNLIWMKGRKEAAVIESRHITDEASKSQIEVNGRFMSSYMDRRLIRPKVVYDGTVELAMRQLLSGAVALPRVTLGQLNGFEETVSFQATYKNLLTYEIKLSKCSDIAFRLRPDFEAKVIYFETYKGTDHTAGQTANQRIIFSEAYDNLEKAEYQENDQLEKTTVYIGGQGQGDDRVIVSFGEEYTGLDRRELFVDARDLTKQSGMSDQTYAEKLLQRGKEAQAENRLTESFDCEILPDGNFVYRRDYDLGDIVTVRKKAWGITRDLRITEVQEIYERGAMKIVPVFGDAIPETIDWSDE